MKINAMTQHRPVDPEYYRAMIDSTGLYQREIAELCGIQERRVRHIVAGTRELTYPEQVCIELVCSRMVAA